jgi:hypothetical protein
VCEAFLNSVPAAAAAAAAANLPTGKTLVPVEGSAQVSRSNETNLGNYVCEAFPNPFLLLLLLLLMLLPQICLQAKPWWPWKVVHRCHAATTQTMTTTYARHLLTRHLLLLLPAGKTLVPLEGSAQVSRSNETNLGNYVCEAFLNSVPAAVTAQTGNISICLMVAGGIRSGIEVSMLPMDCIPRIGWWP